MKKTALILLTSLASVAIMSSCEKDEDPTEVVRDSSKPSGEFTASMSGTFVEQNSSGTMGTVYLGKDEEGTQFLKLGTDFETNLATGTVSIYLSTSDTYTADPGSGNPDLRLVGIALENGKAYYKLDPEADSKFTHVIAWCGSANIPFGNAELMDN